MLTLEICLLIAMGWFRLLVATHFSHVTIRSYIRKILHCHKKSAAAQYFDFRHAHKVAGYKNSF